MIIIWTVVSSSRIFHDREYKGSPKYCHSDVIPRERCFFCPSSSHALFVLLYHQFEPTIGRIQILPKGSILWMLAGNGRIWKSEQNGWAKTQKWHIFVPTGLPDKHAVLVFFPLGHVCIFTEIMLRVSYNLLENWFNFSYRDCFVLLNLVKVVILCAFTYSITKESVSFVRDCLHKANPAKIVVGQVFDIVTSCPQV